MENKRRDFLKTACAPVVFSMFGISMLEACSSGDDDGYSAAPVSNGGGMNSGTSQNAVVTIDLNNSNFSKLASVGGWMNYMDENMLLLRISDTQIRAFTNICPHQGSNNQWSHSDSKFICANHGRSFNDDCSSALTCYNTMIEGTTLTVNR
ncbi:MAG: Rieske 2Fe-2S domain-containing protein [Flavobacteriaceae bacterium]